MFESFFYIITFSTVFPVKIIEEIFLFVNVKYIDIEVYNIIGYK